MNFSLPLLISLMNLVIREPNYCNNEDDDQVLSKKHTHQGVLLSRRRKKLSTLETFKRRTGI